MSIQVSSNQIRTETMPVIVVVIQAQAQSRACSCRTSIIRGKTERPKQTDEDVDDTAAA